MIESFTIQRIDPTRYALIEFRNLEQSIREELTRLLFGQKELAGVDVLRHKQCRC